MKKQPKITSFFKPIQSSVNGTLKNGINDHDKGSKRGCEVIESDEEISVISEVKSNSSSKQTQSTIKTKQKPCPFYKKLPDTSFAVDAFNYGSIPGVDYYFLTHFHSDHYIGLKKSFRHPIICSPITGRLVARQLGVYSKYIITLPLNETKIINGVEIIFEDANHCPGAVIILFTLSSGKRILHTGDFRASRSMECIDFLTTSPIDVLYLDTTYLNPQYDFISQQESIDLVVDYSRAAFKKCSKTLFVCGSYSVGKEKVFMAICESLDLKIWMEPYKRRLLDCYQDSKLNSCLLKDPKESQIHVLPMRHINFKYLSEHFSKFRKQFNCIVAFKPTGWENRNNGIVPRISGNITVYGIPYSEHSSYRELKEFVQFLKPKKIIPTANNGNPSSRQKMDQLIKSWI